MNKLIQNRTTFLKQLAFEILGSILIAAAIHNFAVAAKFPMTGFSGISILLYRFFGISIGWSTILLNIPVALLCCKLLGKEFFLNSLRCIVISSIFIDYIAPLFPIYQGDRLLAALCTGIIGGFGYTWIYMQNSSTGGMDFIIMSIKSIFPYLSLGKIVFLADMGIVLMGGILLGDMDGIIYGMIVNFLFAVVADQLMYGMNAGKLALIATDDGQKIANVIDHCTGRGSTILEGYGAFQRDQKEVVLCACSNKEMYQIQKAVKQADPHCFMIITESSEVHGEGFHMLKVGEKKNN